MEEKGYVNIRFIVFLKATLGKMVGTKLLDADTINLNFWESWPKRFYNVRSYDASKLDSTSSQESFANDVEPEPPGQELSAERPSPMGAGETLAPPAAGQFEEGNDSPDEIPATQFNMDREINSTSIVCAIYLLIKKQNIFNTRLTIS